MRRTFALWALLSLFVPHAAEAQNRDERLLGVFAAAEGTQRVRAEATFVAAGSRRANLALSFYTTDGKRIRSYDEELRRKLHLIVANDNLRTFEHLHPPLDADGMFRISLVVPAAGLYHLYADVSPHGAGDQVFRFDATFGRARTQPALHEDPPSPRAVVADGYLATLNSTSLQAGRTTTLTIQITKDGKPAQDLRPYLGAPAHAIFINERDLSYLHVHPSPDAAGSGEMHDMQMAQTSVVNPILTMHVRVREAGPYKLWLQFEGGGRVHVAPFVLIAHEGITRKSGT